MAVVEIRPGRPDDEPGASLLAAFIDEIAGLYPGWDPSQSPSAEPDELAAPNGSFLVAYLDGVPVGCGAFKRLDPETCEVKRVYVSPEARGSGVARRMLAALEDGARELGFRRVQLDTGANQEGAAVLFRSAGYAPIDDYNANPWATYWFEKDLCEPR
jgi:GNAT superfamily N-acetyltransferase